MERQMFRAVRLTLLMGTVLSCMAPESSEQTTEADFTTTIPTEGLERDVEQVFYLGPSATLQVIDETGKAKYLPEPSQSDDEASSGPYTAAYRFGNGACDFSKTVEFKAAFPGHTKPLWVPDGIGSGASEEPSSGVPVRYTFTNPPAEYLGGGVSFCVRFKTVLAAGLGSETGTSTASTSSPSVSENSDASPGPNMPSEPQDQESGNLPDKHPEVDLELGPPVHGGAHESILQPDLTNEHKDGVTDPPPVTFHSSRSTTDTTTSQPATSAHHRKQTLQASSVLSESRENSTEKTLPATEDGHEVQSGDGDHNGAPPRRLDEASAVKEAYLTVVVHSAAWSLAGGMGAVSSLSIVASALLQIS
ncbi:unnamed protein product [Neospora caninum Liverpool]|uniref:Toxoplasma gondii family A protein n=1 Tax=Neospora caninum (strain Liverpool) TaxID=572307 RepID=F0VRJ6_NEOCL|nr:uncharacterized protein NCLIV_067690 [Neospora caninum Liverpool]CBZ56344.1 unnamed protein product [Neospora caninum Liverpool]CEL71104.1 TPA: hypothetical protein BN1204_067690 [Neospora caninum Liverpool]|eukprot:XP_003886369.1 uncharacterized protein NCLIV_067690 [Neospora caninum Liverpool]